MGADVTHKATQNKTLNIMYVLTASLICASSIVYTSTSLAGPDSHRRIAEPIDYDKTSRWAPSQAQVAADAQATAAAQEDAAGIAASKVRDAKYRNIAETLKATPSAAAMTNREQLITAHQMIEELRIKLPNLRSAELTQALKLGGLPHEGLTLEQARHSMQLSLLNSEREILAELGKMPEAMAGLEINRHAALKGAAILVEKNPRGAGRFFHQTFFEGALKLTGDRSLLQARAAKLLSRFPDKKTVVGGILGFVAAGGVLASESQNAKTLSDEAAPSVEVQKAEVAGFAPRRTSK